MKRLCGLNDMKHHVSQSDTGARAKTVSVLLHIKVTLPVSAFVLRQETWSIHDRVATVSPIQPHNGVKEAYQTFEQHFI